MNLLLQQQIMSLLMVHEMLYRYHMLHHLLKNHVFHLLIHDQNPNLIFFQLDVLRIVTNILRMKNKLVKIKIKKKKRVEKYVIIFNNYFSIKFVSIKANIK